MTKKLGTILLVEDNADDSDLTIRALKKNSIKNDVVLARDGAEALEYLFATGQYAGRDKYDLPQIVLLDLKLPKVDGLTVLREVRTNTLTKSLPMVILTSSREDRDLIEGYNLGVNSYIRKPVDFVAFADAVQQLGLYWLILNETPPVNKKQL